MNVCVEDSGALQDIQMLLFTQILKADSVWDYKTQNIESVHSFGLRDVVQEEIHLVVC